MPLFDELNRRAPMDHLPAREAAEITRDDSKHDDRLGTRRRSTSISMGRYLVIRRVATVVAFLIVASVLVFLAVAGINLFLSNR